jgi:hypothetical protein
MRKILLASAAVLGATGGLALAQTAPFPPPAFPAIPIAPPGPVPNQMQGQYLGPLQGGPAANNNLNTFGTATAGSAVAPQPGTVVIRLNGKIYAGVDLSYGNLLQSPKNGLFPAAYSAAGATNTTGPATNSTSGYKLNPVSMESYLRLYPGIDGMATNGLRYGASSEIRENFEGGNSFTVSTAANGTGPTANYIVAPSSVGTFNAGSAANASGVSSAQTLFVRRAFVYIGSDQIGIIRLGQGDGLPGIYDATGIFTIGSWDGGIGNLNNAGVQAVTPNNYLISWPFLSGNGTEYGNNKIVYLSPSFFGVDVGFEYAPNQGNSFTNSVTSDPLAVGPCNSASNNCENVISGIDASRWINRWGFGGRFVESFAGATIQGYGEYIISGKENWSGAVNPGPANLGYTAAGAATAFGPAGNLPQNFKYDAQNFFNGGLSASYLGFTAAGDVTFGRTNGSNAMVTTGGAPMKAELASVSYAYGPFSAGVIGAIVDSQGAVQLTGISQRHEAAFAVGGAYKIAPGINLCLEYQYEQKHQGGFDFDNSATGGGPGALVNNIHVQGLSFAAIVNW